MGHCVLQHTERVDFTYNPLADPRFIFYDHALVEAVKLENLEVQAFFRLLALCHTVMAEEKTEGEETKKTVKFSESRGRILHLLSPAGELYYQAQSPDEGALVTAARNFGFVFRSRTPDSVCIVEMGQQRSYELLAILDFNNVRKRMSVIGAVYNTLKWDEVNRFYFQLEHNVCFLQCAARRESSRSSVKVRTPSSTSGFTSPAAN